MCFLQWMVLFFLSDSFDSPGFSAPTSRGLLASLLELHTNLDVYWALFFCVRIRPVGFANSKRALFAASRLQEILYGLLCTFPCSLNIKKYTLYVIFLKSRRHSKHRLQVFLLKLLSILNLSELSFVKEAVAFLAPVRFLEWYSVWW